MGRLFDQITSLDNLAQAWEEVADNKGSPGIDGVTVEAFARYWEANLIELRREVRGNRYRPERLQRFTIPKRDGSPRLLGNLTVREKVLQRAVLRVLTFLTRQGKLRGRLTPPTGKNLPLRRRQYGQADDPDFCLGLSRAIVGGKLRNSRTMARRMIRGGLEQEDVSKQIERLKVCLKNSTRSADIAGLMGQEGRAARAYFVIFRVALNERLRFASRTRRPPKDPANALLSLGYSLLTTNLISALEVVGLDPYCGFFHGPATYGRPALTLDLMEEFRPVIVDSVVLTVVNKRMLSEKDFETKGSGDKQGVYLNRRGLRIFFEQYTRRLNTPVFHPLAGRALSYQKIFEVQARQVARLIQGEIGEYQPFLVK